MSSSIEVRQTITDIISKLDVSPKDEKQRIKSLQEVSTKLLSQLDGEGHAIEKLYFGYLIVEFFNRQDLDQRTRNNFILALFPAMLNKRQAALVSQIISLALTLKHGPLLDCLEPYLRNCDSITFPSIPVGDSLARNSPLFCSAVISRGYFANHPTSKDHLTEWLRTLVDTDRSVLADHSINLNKAIRFAFLDRPSDYELHLVLLSLIRGKRAEHLNNQFIIDLATSIANSPLDNRPLLVDRFAQMFIVAFASRQDTQPSNQLKNILLTKFPDSVLMRAACK